MLPGNEMAWRLWMYIHTQWRAGPSGVIGIDYTAINFVCETMELEFAPAVFRKIRVLEAVTLNHIREKEAKANGS